MFCDGSMTTGDWIWMGAFWVVLFGLLGALLVSVSRWRLGRGYSEFDAGTILDARLARGEVTVDEYREQRAILAETR